MKPSRLNLIGRWLALIQGLVWFFLLIFGGIGLIFGPAGWIAAAAGKRAPGLSAILLIVPTAVCAVSWSRAIFAPSATENLVATAAIVAAESVPALLATTLILRGSRPPVSGSSDIHRH
jgi:hypothetical protein